MTVINAMKFNGSTGGLVADSQSSTQVRKYDFADKVYPIKDNSGTVVLIGGTGASDLLYETVRGLEQSISSKETFALDEVVKQLNDRAISVKRGKIDSYLASNFSIGTTRAQSGEGIGNHILTDVRNALTGQGNPNYEGGFLMIGKDKKDIEIYVVPFGGAYTLVARPYESVGSGRDASDRVLGDYIGNMKREDRADIPFVEGMAALIRATNASNDTNPGVGGVQVISYFNDKGIITLGEDESRLASEIVRVKDAELIKPEELKEGLDTLLNQPGSFESVESEIFKKSPAEYDKIMRLLRGYK